MMINTSIRLAACALLASTALAAPAFAQNSTAPKYINVDSNNVDLTTGLVSLSIDEGGIGGSSEGAVRMQRIWAEGAGWLDNWGGGLYKVTSGGTTKVYLQFGGISDTFTQSGTTYTPDKADGSKLIVDALGFFFYTARDGTVIKFDQESGDPIFSIAYSCPGADPGTCQIPLSITRPNGLKFTLGWNTARYCVDIPGEPCVQMYNYRRLRTVNSSAGFSMIIGYGTDNIGSGPAPPPAWLRRTTASFNNSAGSPSPVPSITYTYPASNVIEFYDPAARMWRLTTDASGRITGVRRPGSASNNLSYTYGSAGTVSSATVDGVTTNYSRTVAGSTGTMTATNALSQQTVVISDLTKGRPTSFKDGLNRTTSFQYDTNARLTRTTQPLGNYVQLTYDARGNVTQSKAVAKAGSGLADIITSASFDATCTNVVKCNKPNTTTDPRANVTDYSYDATHGGVLTVTQPAPAIGAVRPQTRVSYSAVAGPSGVLVTLPSGVSACQATASCTGTVDETKASATYNSNLLPTSISRGDGSGGLTATSTMTYDQRGNMLTVDGPLAGTDDTTRLVYDAADQRVGIISPDPDGAGSLKNRAVKTIYRPDGQVDAQERGTTSGQTDADWAAFVSLEAVDIGYDTNSRPITQSLASGGTTYALSQSSYDTVGRVSCTATRMNSATFGSLPASACTLGTTGSFGPDRIAKTIYDAAGQVTQQQVAFGTTDQANERTLTYTSNGKLFTLTDAENNKTTYEYDGHDRLLKTRMPLPTKGSNASSTTDYEQLGYDLGSNVTSRRLRDASLIAFAYDNLDRVTLKDLPGSEIDTTYAYDNLGRLNYAIQPGHVLSFTYDALSRNLHQGGPFGNSYYDYDLASRRTRLTYPGGDLFIDYDYLVTGETVKLRENGATSGVGVLATLAYDDLGRRTGLTFGNGASQAYGYDPVSRLASLTNDLTGTTNDLSQTLAYNPASQIASTVRTGDAYAWTGHFNQNATGTPNGLNQLTQVGAKSLTHDARGNVTAFGTKSFSYSSENLLQTGPNGTTLGYDPLMRLYQTASGATTLRLAYDGLDRIAEYDGSNALQRRYVHGPNMDEPFVWYEGSGTTDRRFLGSDERGSIVSVTDGSGALLGLNKYDEFGQPQNTNLGTWGYTGQAWLPTMGVWYYKAREFDPELGRFLQTDPIGYEGGVNLYAYVSNDPINWIDPLGLSCIPVHTDGEVIVVPACQNPNGGYAGVLEFQLSRDLARQGTVGDRGASDAELDSSDKPCATPAAAIPPNRYGTTGQSFGDNPRVRPGGNIVSDLPDGSALAAFIIFTEASVRAGDYYVLPGEGNRLWISGPSGITLRAGTLSDSRFRLDIPADKLNTNAPETVHLGKKDEPLQCPTNSLGSF